MPEGPPGMPRPDGDGRPPNPYPSPYPSPYPAPGPGPSSAGPGAGDDAYAAFRGQAGGPAPVRYPPPPTVPPPGHASGPPAGGVPGTSAAPGPSPTLRGPVRSALAVATVVLVVVVGAFAARSRAGQGSDRAIWEATTIRLPGQVLGMPRQPVATGSALVALLGRAATAGDGSGLAVYGRAPGEAASVVVLAERATAPMPDDVRRANWDSFVQGLPRRAGAVALAERDAGPLGGRTACGPLPEGPLLCLSMDAAAVVAVVAVADVPGGVEALAAIRETVEHRS